MSRTFKDDKHHGREPFDTHEGREPRVHTFSNRADRQRFPVLNAPVQTEKEMFINSLASAIKRAVAVPATPPAATAPLPAASAATAHPALQSATPATPDPITQAAMAAPSTTTPETTETQGEPHA